MRPTRNLFDPLLSSGFIISISIISISYNKYNYEEKVATRNLFDPLLSSGLCTGQRHMGGIAGGSMLGEAH